MEQTIAESLADSVISEFQQMPIAVERMHIDRKELVRILGDTEYFDHKKKMQFSVSKTYLPFIREKNRLYQYNVNRQLIQSLFPRRILTTDNKPYKPEDAFLGSLVKIYQEMKEYFHDNRNNNRVLKSTFDAEVICREMRLEPRLSEIRARKFKEGVRIFTMAQFYALANILKEAPHYGGNQDIQHIPLFFMPNATKEERDIFAVYSLFHQYPLQEEVGHYLEKSVFTKDINDAYHDYFTKYEPKIKEKARELKSLKKDEKKNRAKIKELENKFIPFLGE